MGGEAAALVMEAVGGVLEVDVLEVEVVAVVAQGVGMPAVAEAGRDSRDQSRRVGEDEVATPRKVSSPRQRPPRPLRPKRYSEVAPRTQAIPPPSLSLSYLLRFVHRGGEARTSVHAGKRRWRERTAAGRFFVERNSGSCAKFGSRGSAVRQFVAKPYSLRRTVAALDIFSTVGSQRLDGLRTC